MDKTAAGYGLEKQLCQKQNPRHQYMDEWKSVRSGPVEILGIHTNQEWTSLKEVKIRVAQANSAMKRLVLLWKNKATS